MTLIDPLEIFRKENGGKVSATIIRLTSLSIRRLTAGPALPTFAGNWRSMRFCMVTVSALSADNFNRRVRNHNPRSSRHRRRSSRHGSPSRRHRLSLRDHHFRRRRSRLGDRPGRRHGGAAAVPTGSPPSSNGVAIRHSQARSSRRTRAIAQPARRRPEQSSRHRKRAPKK